jgi:mannosylglycoprotein endo-beta-mannosidase
MQAVKITDPHLVSTFHDDFKRSYLHCTLQLENKSSWLADCTLNIQVSAELEGDLCLVEHLQSFAISIPPSSVLEYTVPPVS